MKSNLKRRLHTGIAVLSSFVLFLPTLSVTAEETKESLENKTSSLEQELAGINEELFQISEQISTAEMQIEITNGEIQRTKDSLALAQLEEAEQYQNMKTRIKYMYETGNASLLEMLFSAKNMSDFLNKADFIQNISDYDRQMLLELQTTRDTIAQEEALLLEQQSSLIHLQQELDHRKTELQIKAEATSTDLQAFQAQLEQLKAEEAARLAAEAAARKAEEERLAQEAAAQANKPQVPSTPSTPSAPTTPSTPQTGTGSYDDTIVNSKPSDATASDIDLFAALLDCEAIHDYNSMLAVATVIMNRVESPSFPNSIKAVIYASGQFEPVWTGRLDSVLERGASNLAYQVANDAISGSRLTAVSDCYYFLYAGATNRPGTNIGGNLFFQSW